VCSAASVAIVDNDLGGRVLARAVHELIEDDVHAAIDGAQVFPGQDRIERVGPQRVVEHLGELILVEGLEALEGRVAQQAALLERRQNGHLVVEGLAKRAAIVDVNYEGLVAERDHALVVVPVHVAREEVEHGQVHEIEQHLGVIGHVLEDPLHTVVLVHLPVGLLLLRVRASVRVHGGLPLDNWLARQVDLSRALQSVSRLATCRVRRVTVVGAVACEARVAAWREEERLGQLVLGLVPQICGHVEDAADGGRHAEETEQLVEMKRGDLGVVTLKVNKVEVIGWRFIISRHSSNSNFCY
jgi:hypothetical protein